MFIMIEVLSALIIFLVVKEFAWWVTEEGHVPPYLNYPPWNCFKCFSWWCLIAVFVSIGIFLQAYITSGVGITLAILDTIAYVIHQRKNTLTIEDYDKLMNEKNKDNEL